MAPIRGSKSQQAKTHSMARSEGSEGEAASQPESQSSEDNNKVSKLAAKMKQDVSRFNSHLSRRYH